MATYFLTADDLRVRERPADQRLGCATAANSYRVCEALLFRPGCEGSSDLNLRDSLTPSELCRNICEERKLLDLRAGPCVVKVSKTSIRFGLEKIEDVCMLSCIAL